MYEPHASYVLNLAANIALCNGGDIGEVQSTSDRINARLSADAGADEAAIVFSEEWGVLSSRLERLADEDLERGRGLSAAEKLRRSAVYRQTSERMAPLSDPGRLPAYRASLDLFDRSDALDPRAQQRLDLPYGGSTFPGILRGTAEGERRPCIIFVNGFDSTKEQILGVGFDRELERRGIAMLAVDQPGTGEALRLNGLPATPESESWASVCVDALAQHPGIDPDRIGIVGWSLGGYFAPRAAAHDPRLALCVAWGGNYDWGAMQERRRQNQGALPVPHYWDHAKWVWGVETDEQFWQLVPRINLHGVMEKLRSDLLVLHGAGDRQIPIEYAHRTYDEAVNARSRELKIIDAEFGGVEHCSVDSMPNTIAFIADWIAETFGTNAPRVDNRGR